jgi:hypothetical protein
VVTWGGGSRCRAEASSVPVASYARRERTRPEAGLRGRGGAWRRRAGLAGTGMCGGVGCGMLWESTAAIRLRACLRCNWRLTVGRGGVAAAAPCASASALATPTHAAVRTARSRGLALCCVMIMIRTGEGSGGCAGLDGLCWTPVPSPSGKRLLTKQALLCPQPCFLVRGAGSACPA